MCNVASCWLCFAYILFVCLFWHDSPQSAMASSFTRFLDHTQRRTTVGRTPLDEWSARRRDLYLTTHNTHNRQTSMPSVGFETTISAGEWLQTYALDRAVTETDIEQSVWQIKRRWTSTIVIITSHWNAFRDHSIVTQAGITVSKRKRTGFVICNLHQLL